jgi:hypothetical protein
LTFAFGGVVLNGRVKRSAIALVVATAMFVIGISSAHAAPAPRHLGQPSPTGIAPCSCSAVQFTDANLAAGPYKVPYDGVLTKSGFGIGLTQVGDWVQTRTFEPTSANTAKVVSQGEKHPTFGLTAGTVNFFYEREPAFAGDVLGARFNTGAGGIDYTPHLFESPQPFDVAGSVQTGAGGFPEVGDAFTVSSTPSKRRVNVEAVLEPDEDHDVYGDISQDLCPGSPLGNAACSGSLFGSNFEGNHGGSGGSGFDALYIQRAVRGASTAAPFDGVVVRWRVLTRNTSDYGIRVVGPTTGSSFKVLGSSATEHVAFAPSPTIGGITTFQTRLPIPAGGYVGLATASMSQPESVFPSPGSTLAKLHDGLDGTIYNESGAISTQELAYDADIEPDADHDGYGDITQDSCPNAATAHDGQCPVVDVFPLPATPRITGFEVAPKKFRVKAKGASAKLKLTLSREATVAFGIEAKRACAKKAKGTKARCKPGFHAVQTITQKLPAGPGAVRYSARLRSQAPLPSGPYLVTAVPTAGGLTGTAAQATFKVLPPRHRAGH